MTSTIPTRLFKSVLFPDPFGPTIETTSPGATLIETPCTTGLPLYPAVMSSATSGRPRTSADKVGLHDVLLGTELSHRSLGQHLPLDHHDNRVGELIHDRELVLDHHDRDAFAAELEQEPADLVRELGVHPELAHKI